MNPHLTGLDVAVLAVTAVAAVWAAVRNAQAWRHGFPTQRPLRGSIAVLAAAYVVAYLVLAVTDVDPARWSSVMRGVSLVVWPVVWTLPASSAVRAWRTLGRRVVAEAERRHLEEHGGPGG